MGNRAFVAVVATLLASLATWPLALNPSEGPGSSQVGQLLSDTKSLVSLLKSDISTLDLFALSGGRMANACRDAQSVLRAHCRTPHPGT